MQQQTLVLPNKDNHLTFFYHNIEALKLNRTALMNHFLTNTVDFICLVETWLEYQVVTDSFEVEGYKFIHRSRKSSFNIEHPFHAKKHGGVGLYVKKNQHKRDTITK